MRLNGTPKGRSSTLQRRAIVAAVVTLVLGGVVAAAVAYHAHSQDPPPDPPTLEFQTHFPAGYDRQEVPLKAVGYDGRSRCANIWKLESIEDKDWTDKGIRYTSFPTGKSMEKAQPLLNAAYEYIGTTPNPATIKSTAFPTIKPAANCEVEYEAKIWKTIAVAANREPISILDGLGRPYHFAATEVQLGGDGDGKGGTRFLLEASGDVSGIRVFVSLFRTGEFNVEGRVPLNISAEPLRFGSFIFDVPAPAVTEGTLVLMPVDHAGNVPEAVLNGTLSFTRLMRLQTIEVQIQQGTAGLPEQPVTSTELPLGGVRATSLPEAVRLARQQPASEDLHALGNAMFVVQQAFEPRAKLLDPRLVQPAAAHSSTLTDVLHLAGDGTARETQATYHLAVTQARTTFTIAVRDSALASTALREAAEATAVLSRIAADGATIVESASGPSINAAVTALHRSVNIAGHHQSLHEAPSGGRDLLRQADHAFMAAAIIAGGWEFYQAGQAERPLDRLEHQLVAGQIILEAAFSMTVPGALLVATSNLAVHVLEQFGPPGLVEGLAMSIQRSRGEMSAHDANAAWQRAVRLIQEYAEANEASFLEQHIHKTDPAPVGMARLIILVVFAFSIVAIIARIRGR